MSSISSMRCWIATDGGVGNEKQCQALAHYLGVDPEIFEVDLRQPWDALAPHLATGGRRAILGPLRHRLDGELPDLLITAGRRATLVSTTLRRLSAGSCFTVHVLDPRIDPGRFDRVVCPHHDGLEGDNVIRTRGALHDVDDRTLDRARHQHAPLGDLPAPRVVLLVGASNRAYTIDTAHLDELARAALHWRGAGSVLVSTSRRTGAELQRFVRERFADVPGTVWCGQQDGPNPYRGFLAWADRILVTADSVNMVSEACGVGVPVHCEPPGPGHRRFQHFHRWMRESGHVLGLYQDGKAPAPLRETPEAARHIAEALAGRSAGH